MTDVVFNAATSRSAQKKLRYQHALDHGKGDTHSTTDMALTPLPFLPRIAPWLTASMLVPHGSHDLPMVFSMHNKPQLKSKTPSHITVRYEKSGSDVVPKLRMQKPIIQSTNGSHTKVAAPWWGAETEKVGLKTVPEWKVGNKKDST